ncbi:MAG: hypothetical protein CVU49_03630 [Candidatus Cloacimonetes bacterium HGW-Cloacimonetes-2]|nr:MAG: hypothetical protein CVU49_03630 [Candidatus Cloacimonetes bacterium HGW-Cloacimonetes-2]
MYILTPAPVIRPGPRRPSCKRISNASALMSRVGRNPFYQLREAHSISICYAHNALLQHSGLFFLILIYAAIPKILPPHNDTHIKT